LLGKLTRTVADFAQRETQLSGSLATRNYQATRRHRDAIYNLDKALEAQIAEARAVSQQEADRLTAIHDRRMSRVQRLHGVALRTLPQRARDAKGNWLAELQMRQLRGEKALAAGIQQNDADFTAAKAALLKQRALIEQIEANAKAAMRGYPSLAKPLTAPQPASPATATPADLLDDLRAKVDRATECIACFRQLPHPRLFAMVPLPVLIIVAVAIGAAVAFARGAAAPAYLPGTLLAVLIIGTGIAVHRKGAIVAKEQGVTTTEAVLAARRAFVAACAAADSRHVAERQRLQDEYNRAFAELEKKWTRTDDLEADFEKTESQKLGAQLPRIAAKIQGRLQRKLAELQSRTESRIEQFRSQADGQRKQFEAALQGEMVAVLANEKTQWDQLDADWKRESTPLFDEVAKINAASSARFPAWTSQFVEAWTPPDQFTPATKFARLDVDLSQRSDAIPAKLALPGPPQLSIPVALTYPGQGSLLVESRESCGGTTTRTLNNVILRLLSTTPPGKLAFTILDPVGLGENFAGLMHLGDYEESLINRHIWTQHDQIDERLGELNAHIEKVIQMYLRNEYASITEYNEQAGSVAEKYYFLVVADFPTGFSETAAKRLQSIAVSGPRCGVFTLIHWDQRQPLPDGFSIDELRKSSVCLRSEGREFVVGKEQGEAGAKLTLDAPPEPALALSLVHKIGKSSVDSNRVQVPFSQIAPAPAEMWTNETTNELRVAVGRTGATKLQYLAIGKGTRQHALFAGKTGSGKSTLFHVIITNLALACSPDQVEFYLIDFKKGVEFKCYATKRLPHARVVAIESDREFALSVLQRVDEELKRRGDMFRKLGVQDVAGYKRAGGSEPMPRSLLLIDEFQEFFIEDDTIAQTASLLFDRIVRQGRAFGIHVLLGSQTLGGAYSLARATLGQMVIRVALQCNEADAYLIMDEGNSAPRLLSRPGEGIYNDAAGAIEGNSPFQVVWLPDDERDQWLEKVRALAEQRHDRHSGPIVFEGNAPADIRENELLAAALDSNPTAPPSAARCWLGAPNSIKGPTEAAFRRQSGDHLLIVGQREDAEFTMVALSVLALAAQLPVGSAQFIIIHATTPGSTDAAMFEKLAKIIPHGVTLASTPEIPDVIRDITATMKARASGETPLGEAPSVFLFIHGLHKFKKLRHEDDFSFSSGNGEASPGAAFNDLITEGSALGIHIIATVDTFNNLNRSMNRKAQSEFEMRVVFQMSANDSASLIDSPKAANLGLHRALLYNEQAGHLETFRPYATPDAEWLEHAAARLSARTS